MAVSSRAASLVVVGHVFLMLSVCCEENTARNLAFQLVVTFYFIFYVRCAIGIGGRC